MVQRAALVLLALVASACGSASFEISFGGGSGTVQEAATFLIENELSEQVGEQLTADCPEVPDPEVGTTFSCTGTTDDGLVIDFAGIVDREDHIDLTSTNLVISGQLAAFEAAVAASVEATVGFAVTVECGDDFVVLDEASAMSCAVTDPGGVVAELQVRNIDLAAETFEWKILEAE